MTTNIKIAWRNLWRNKRRTLITVASIFFGVLFSAYMSSMQEGSYEKMVDMVVKYYSGYMQVHNEEYWDNQNINNTFEQDAALEKLVLSNKDVDLVVPRLESFALASSDDLTKVVMVTGIDPEPENRLTSLAENVVDGSYLKKGDQGILIGQGLAEYLNLGVNDTLVMIGQGFHGISAANMYPIRGIIKHASPEINKQIVYMGLSNCQDYFSAYDRLTSLVVNVKELDDLDHVLKELKETITSPYSIMSWEEMSPEMVQQIESDRAGGIIMKAILYLVIGFGILGTIMMMIAERKREFAVMIAIGMQRIKLGTILFYETILIGLIGSISGLLISIPILTIQAQYPIPLTGQAAQFMEDYGFEPYMFFSLMPSVFWQQALTVFIITLFISIYSFYKSRRFNLIQSLHS